ncbi:MAG: tetratricopeptide repeat protein [Candidatus Melainabacteria bacterium]|nr:MAG: tetratricopeptide repeat protein [Candidatus Melainabacteria bacterium]
MNKKFMICSLIALCSSFPLTVFSQVIDEKTILMRLEFLEQRLGVKPKSDNTEERIADLEEKVYTKTFPTEKFWMRLERLMETNVPSNVGVGNDGWVDPKPSKMKDLPEHKSSMESESGDFALWSIYLEKGQNLAKEKKYRDALKVLECARNIVRTDDSNNNSRLRITLETLKPIYQSIGATKDVEEIQKNQVKNGWITLSLDERIKIGMKLGQDQWSKADESARNGNREFAEEFYLSKLGGPSVHMPNQGYSVDALDRLVRIYCEDKKYEQAEKLIRKVLVDLKSKVDDASCYKKEQLEYSIVLSDLALVFTGQGDLVQAEVLFDQAQGTIKKLLSADDPRLIVWKSDRALLFKKLKKYNLAEKEYEEAFLSARRSKSINELSRSIIAKNYTKFLREIGQLEKAERIERLNSSKN